MGLCVGRRMGVGVCVREGNVWVFVCVCVCVCVCEVNI